MTVYFDNASTTRVHERVAAVMTDIMLRDYANPSSSHGPGRRARLRLEEARAVVASALGASPKELFFTSGGTEANNWAILGAAQLRYHAGRHIISSAAEHDAVRRPLEYLKSQGWDVTFLSPGKDGRISIDDFAAALREDTVLASIMLVNNETGAINPISEMTRLLALRRLKTLFHCDAVQGFMKTPFTAKSLGADLISVSAHKIHGPKGVGALYVKSGLRLPPLLRGGSQEGEMRAGTESLPAIAGFAEAVSLAKERREEAASHIESLHHRAVERLQAAFPDGVILSQGGSPYILSFSLPGYRSEVLLNILDAAGICVSKSSACKKGARSHVLEAMGLPPAVIDGALRVSFSMENTLEEVDFFVETLARESKKLRRERT
jgi:cysteine desulfurase